MSASWNVQGEDAVKHAFQARVAIHDGLLFPRFKGGQPIYYTSGFAAMNAVAATVAPLTVVQAVNLQHVLLVLLGLFLASTSLSILARRCSHPFRVFPWCSWHSSRFMGFIRIGTTKAPVGRGHRPF